MPKYVGLLRGVNVGGNNPVPMAELRSLLTSLGHSEVRTYIQSGNVVFTTGTKVSPETLETAIATTFGIKIDVMLRTPAELMEVLEANPFPNVDSSSLHVGFMKAEPPEDAVARLDPDGFLPERFAVRGRERYLFLPAGMGRTKLPAYLDRQLKVPTTVRSWKTVVKLVELAR
jgi:uncharacterized protein (DUF1697 family)